MSTRMNRRAVLAGAAAAVAVPVPAFAVAHPDAALLALGEDIKRALPELYRRKAVADRLYKRVQRAIGWPDNLNHQAFKPASIKLGYHSAATAMNAAHEPLCALAGEALAMPAQTFEGAAVKAIAELLYELGLDDDNPCRNRLWELVKLAGFPLPPWVSWKYAPRIG